MNENCYFLSNFRSKISMPPESPVKLDAMGLNVSYFLEVFLLVKERVAIMVKVLPSYCGNLSVQKRFSPCFFPTGGLDLGQWFFILYKTRLIKEQSA